MSLTRADIGTWLINLDRATDRRAKMETQLARMDLPYTRVSGVDGKARADDLLQTVDVSAFERNMGRRILIGGIGCYHSHLTVWRLFLESGKPVALVLEDDVVFHDDFLPAIDLALQAAPRWDMLKLNCIRAKFPVCQGRIGPYFLHAYIGPATGTGAYLIHRATVERLLPRMLPITRATDHEINRFFLHDFRLFGLEPWPSHVDDGGHSTITGTKFALVERPPKWRRLPHYRLKAANYVRRSAWLLRHGMLFGNTGKS